MTNADNDGAVKTDEAPLPEPVRVRPANWRSMLWMWPAAAIILVALASALFGAYAALLVAGETIGVLLFVAAIRLYGERHWLAAGLAVIAASTIVLAGLQQLHPTRLLANLSESQRRATASLVGGPVDLHGQTINAKKASETEFAGANLTDSNLSGLDLRGKDFDGADAAGASFQGSNLDGANFRGADLRGACLRGARLQGADLSGADMTGADVSGASISTRTMRTAIRWPPKGTSFTPACR